MSAGLILVIAALPVLLALSALFSALETGIFSFQAVRLKELQTTHPRLAETVGRLVARPRRLLGAILFADTVVNLPLMIACLYLIREVVSSPVPFWVTALGIFALVVIVCDLLPKLIAMARPLYVARVGVKALSAAMPVLDPLSRHLERWSERTATLLTPARFQPRRTLSEEELETLVELSAEDGALHESESEMIQEIIKLGDKTARDVMTPRTDAYVLPDDLSPEEAITALKACRHRRVPVYGETPDDIVGVLDVKRFLLHPGTPYMEQLSTPSYVPETMAAMELLRSFLKWPQRMAIVVDEFGGTEGIVTLSDVVEEILSDALPAAGHEESLQEIGPNRWLVDAAMRLDDLSEELGIELEEDGIDTIGGLIFNMLGYLPPPGARVHLDGVSFTVRRTSQKRIHQLVMTFERKPVSAENLS